MSPYATVDKDAMDDVKNPNVAHLYVTYDYPESRHTLAVARVVFDADHSEPARAFATATRLLSTAEARKRAEGSTTTKSCSGSGGGGGNGVGYGTDGTTLRACVDRFFATGLSMFPDPVNQPRFVRELLLEGCHEVLRRAGFGEDEKNESVENMLPWSTACLRAAHSLLRLR